MTCTSCGRRTAEVVDGWCRLCAQLPPVLAYRAWLRLLDADQQAGRGAALLTGNPAMGRRDGATVDLALYVDDPAYRARVDAKEASDA